MTTNTVVTTRAILTKQTRFFPKAWPIPNRPQSRKQSFVNNQSRRWDTNMLKLNVRPRLKKQKLVLFTQKPDNTFNSRKDVSTATIARLITLSPAKSITKSIISSK